MIVCKGPDVFVYIMATEVVYNHSSITHIPSNISTLLIIIALSFEFFLEGEGGTAEPMVRSWGGFSAHSEKQQLDERAGRERGNTREPAAGGESMPSSQGIYSCSFRKNGIIATASIYISCNIRVGLTNFVSAVGGNGWRVNDRHRV